MASAHVFVKTALYGLLRRAKDLCFNSQGRRSEYNMQTRKLLVTALVIFFGSLNNSRPVLYTHKHLRRVRSLVDDGSNSPHCCSNCHPFLPRLISRLGGGGGVFTIVQLIAPSSLLPYRCDDAGISRVCQSELEAVSPLLLVLLFDGGGGGADNPFCWIASERS
jgi:hypothetical protein